MPAQLQIQVGQYTDKGRKDINQDFHAVYIPKEPQLSSKGIAIMLADGISSSKVSQVASQAAVTGFLEDYYCTSDAWSVKKSVQCVLFAINSWLYAQTRHSQFRYDKDKGYVCTFSAMVMKSRTAHLFHVGDTRVYRLRNKTLEQLTQDHRVWVSQDQSYLSRALGIDQQVELDYKHLSVEVGDIFLFATDGVYEYVKAHDIIESISANSEDLESAAQRMVKRAVEKGSADNLTLQIIKVVSLPDASTREVVDQFSELPFAPTLKPRMLIDGYNILREIHASSRSHIYLAVDTETDTQVILKTPSMDLRGDPAYLERFLLEEWIARRLDNAHILKAYAPARKRNYFYVVTEYVNGQTLAQWMIDNPRPSLEVVRSIIEQVAKGLHAMHKMEMLHQDLRPNNIMIDETGTVKIIDFGSTRVAGLIEDVSHNQQQDILGTEQYTAPEYFIGEIGSSRSDLFSLGVIAYQMLSGKLPYGAEVSRSRTKSAQRKLKYRTLCDSSRDIPIWIDETIKKAVHWNPCQRYEVLSEFIYDLRHPNHKFISNTRPPLIERDPALLWKGVSLLLFIIILLLLLKDQL